MKVIASVLFVSFIFTTGCGGLDAPHNGASELHGSDDTDDQVCTEDPAGGGIPELDIVSLDLTGNGKVVAKVTFSGDTETWYADETEQLPFSLQFWLFGGTYVEAFFKDKGSMKVADGKADVSHSFSGNMLTITLTGFEVDQVETVRASTFHWSYGDWSGSCDDELEINYDG